MPESLLQRPTRAHAAPVERVFLGWDRAALRTAAARLAGHYSDGETLDMGAATIVLPGSRAGRRLRALLLDEAASRRLRLVPPRIITIGALPELLYSPSRPLAPDALCRPAWARALRRLPAERLARLFSAAPDPGDVRGWARLARTVAALHQEVGGAGLRFADVVACCGDGLLFADTERWSVLAEAQALFESELGGLNLADRGLARVDALAGRSLALDRDLWLVGVVEMPPVLHRMLESLPAGRLRVLVHAPEAEAGGFDALGALRPEAWTARPLPLPDDRIAVRGQPAEQADEVVRTLASLGGRYAAEEIVIAAPNEELVPYLEQRLGDAGVAVRAAGGTPVDRSPVARLLAAFADYLDGGRFDACAALARHPDLWRWLRRAPGAAAGALAREDGWLEALDAYRTECLPAHLDGGVASTRRGVMEAVEAFHRALNDPHLLGRMRGRRTLAAWMPEIMTLVAEVYGEPALDRTRPADRRLLDACAALRDAAAGLFLLPPGLDEECDAPAAIRLLLDETAGGALAPDPDPDAVELLGWLELRLDDAPVAVVTGFNEPFLPESVNAHPFLPNALRERLGLEDNARRYARDCYELTALLHSREEVRVVAGRRSATGDPLRPSRLMFAVEGRALAERVRRFFDDVAAPPPPPGEAEPPAGGGFHMPAEQVLRAPEPIRKLRVTAFRQILADPYTFALEHILRLAPLDDRPRELDGLRFGNLAHAVLERFGRSADVHCSDAARVRRRLCETLDDEARERFGARPLPAVRIQVEQLRARLEPFARWHAARVGEGWRVVGVECETPEEGVAFDVDGEPIHLTGRIDRIDYHPDRRAWALFDYKTGDRGEAPEETHRAGKGDARVWTDLQLPLYRHLLPLVRDADGRRPHAEGEPGAIELAYIALPRDLDGVGPLVAGWSEEELREADECARAVIRLLRQNVFTFDPQRARASRNSALAAVLGLGYLESAAGAEEEG
jgi:hypothetical protein